MTEEPCHEFEPTSSVMEQAGKATWEYDREHRKSVNSCWSTLLSYNSNVYIIVSVYYAVVSCFEFTCSKQICAKISISGQLRGSQFQNFSGGAFPQTPLARRAYVCHGLTPGIHHSWQLCQTVLNAPGDGADC